MIGILGPTWVGAAVGWMLYYFMRKYEVFSPRTLAATLAALAGGPVLTVLERWAAIGKPELGLWYFLGVGIGFFAYALYAGVLSLLFAFNKIKSLPRFEVAVACGGGIAKEALDRLERIMEFESALEKWGRGELDEASFKAALPTLGFTRLDYFRAKRDHDSQLEIGVEVLRRFDEGGYSQYLAQR
jgi:hypothetical protein